MKKHWYKTCIQWGNVQLKRLLVYVGGGALTFDFVKEGVKGTLSWHDYLAYAFALTMLYSPSLALHALKIWKGLPEKSTTGGNE